MKHKAHLFILALFLLLSLGNFEQVRACWCRGVTGCEATNQASAVFVGKVLKVISDEKLEDNEVSFSPKERILFQIKEKISGVRSKTIELKTGGGFDCDYYPFKKYETYLVYAYQDAETGELNAGLCGGTKSFAKANKDLEYLRNIPKGNQNGKIFGSVFGFGFESELNRYDDTTLAGIPLLLTGNGINKTILTNESGDYEVSDLKAGKYSLQVYLPDIYELSSDGKDDSVREIDLNGKGCAEERFFPAIKNILEGTVRDKNGNPLENIEVLLIPEKKADENDTTNDYTEFTGKDGRFTFSNIFPRQYVLGINIKEDEEETTKIFYPNALIRTEALKINFGLGKKLSNYDLVWNNNK